MGSLEPPAAMVGVLLWRAAPEIPHSGGRVGSIAVEMRRFAIRRGALAAFDIGGEFGYTEWGGWRHALLPSDRRGTTYTWASEFCSSIPTLMG
jgi:hypothetical protein